MASSESSTFSESHVPVPESVSFQFPTETVKHRVIAEYQLQRWQAMGILPQGFYPAHSKNLILLCGTCHYGYDSPYPIWVALPDLNPFIAFEKEDYETRTQAALNGAHQPRALLEPQQNGTLCRPYIFRDYQSRFPSVVDWNSFPKRFMGCPQTMILKALHGCFLPYPPDAIQDAHGHTINGGLPSDVADNLNELIKLWNRPDPKVQKPRHKRKRDSGSEDGEQTDEEDDGKGRLGRRGKEGPTQTGLKQQKSGLRRSVRRTQGSGEPVASQSALVVDQWLQGIQDRKPACAEPTSVPASPPISNHSREQTLPNRDEKERASGPYEHWVLGPEKTAADTMADAARWQYIRELNERDRKARQKAQE
ncbi:predicted protein [Uncinocarpus reesii 1704]|uniref:Uncharacterized protein n=1 Tax=Uncinocarpus reesii (strain UAMH 1704) TaxID=336963 RepID=C4JXP3_UNCRE|nr:uncharacterized protein UREG_06416 [Uncinocarpus reesii 1704]EEP81551.1 predicted protein [Uncinocarpus reesii 1704]